MSVQINNSGNKFKNKEYHTVGIIPQFNTKILERGKIYTSNTQIHDRSLCHFPVLGQAFQ